MNSKGVFSTAEGKTKLWRRKRCPKLVFSISFRASFIQETASHSNLVRRSAVMSSVIEKNVRFWFSISSRTNCSSVASCLVFQWCTEFLLKATQAWYSTKFSEVSYKKIPKLSRIIYKRMASLLASTPQLNFASAIKVAMGSWVFLRQLTALENSLKLKRNSEVLFLFFMFPRISIRKTQQIKDLCLRKS